MNELTSGILTPRKIVDYKDVRLSVYSVDDALFWWDAWKSGKCIGQSAAKAICLTEDRCLENAMQWVDAFIFCDEDVFVECKRFKSSEDKVMILRYTPEQLRKLADQADAYTAIASAGGKAPESGTVLEIDGQQLAYLFWWEDGQQYLVEFLDFKPGASGQLTANAE